MDPEEFEACGYLPESDKPFVDLIFANEERQRMYFDFYCSIEIMKATALLCHFAMVCGSAITFRASPQLIHYIHGLFTALDPYPAGFDFSQENYEIFIHYFAEHFNFDLGYNDGLSIILKHFSAILRSENPCHRQNLETFVNGFKNWCGPRLNQICANLGFAPTCLNIEPTTVNNCTQAQIDFPLLVPEYIGSDANIIFDGVAIRFIHNMNHGNNIGYELTGRLNGLYTCNSLRGDATNYMEFLRNWHMLCNNIRSDPDFFIAT